MKIIFYIFLLLIFFKTSPPLVAQDEIETYKNEMYLDEGYYYPEHNDSWEDEYDEAPIEQQEYEAQEQNLEGWEEKSIDESRDYLP